MTDAVERRPPRPSEWFRVHPYSQKEITLLYDDYTEYLVANHVVQRIRDDLPELRLQPTMAFVAANENGEPFFWLVPMPVPDDHFAWAAMDQWICLEFREMIHDHMRVWLLRPGVGDFGDLPSLLDETDPRPGAEQLGQRWQPIEGMFRLEGSALHGDGQVHELLGAIRLRNELLMLFEDQFAAIVQSDRSITASALDRSITNTSDLNAALRHERERGRLRAGQRRAIDQRRLRL